MAGGTRDGRAGVTLLLIGAIVQLVVGLLVLVLGLYFSGLLGGTVNPDRQVLAWVFIGVGALSLAGGEVGLRAFRAGRIGRLQDAWIRGLVASLLPPIALITLVGAILCKLAAAQHRPGTPAEETHPFKL